jgi:pimeloyl-ACP methyl ester carboxylesterase
MGFPESRRNIRAPSERVLPDSWIVPTDCGPVEYGTHGEGSPVLVLHGSGGWDQGIASARGLAFEGFRLITPSRFRYGRTQLPEDPPQPAEADTWAGFLDALKIERAPVIAFSAGAAPAVQFALRHPSRVSALVMVSRARGLTPMPAVVPPSFLLDSFYRFESPMWVLMQAPPRFGYALVAVPASVVPSLPPRERERTEETLRNILPVNPEERITTPTLLISAEDDLYRTLPVARHAAKSIPGAGPTFMPFEARGHLWLGRGHEIWPSVAAFIRGADD